MRGIGNDFLYWWDAFFVCYLREMLVFSSFRNGSFVVFVLVYFRVRKLRGIFVSLNAHRAVPLDIARQVKTRSSR